MHEKELSRDEISILRGKEEDGFGNIFRLVHSLQGRILDRIFVNVCRERLDHLG